MDNWIDKIVEEMGLGDTVPPEDVLSTEVRLNLLEILRRVEFTIKGWQIVRKTLSVESQKAREGLLQSILEADPDDARMFIAVMQVPFLLGEALKYTDSESEQLSLFMVMALNIMATRGYELGRQGLESSGADSGEGSGHPPERE